MPEEKKTQKKFRRENQLKQLNWNIRLAHHTSAQKKKKKQKNSSLCDLVNIRRSHSLN